MRELKNEVSKLREIIKAEGLEARVAEYGKYVCYVMYDTLTLTGLSIEGIVSSGRKEIVQATHEQLTAVEKLKVSNCNN